MAELVKGLLAGRSIVAPVLDRDSIEKLRVSAIYCSEAFPSPQMYLACPAGDQVSGSLSYHAVCMLLKSKAHNVLMEMKSVLLMSGDFHVGDRSQTGAGRHGAFPDRAESLAC